MPEARLIVGVIKGDQSLDHRSQSKRSKSSARNPGQYLYMSADIKIATSRTLLLANLGAINSSSPQKN